MSTGDVPLWLRVVLAILATWRMTHLLANEDGPGDVILKLRRWLEASAAGQLMDCFACLSLWMAAALAAFISPSGSDWLLVTLALSGGAMLLERAGEPRLEIQSLASGSAHASDGRADGEIP